MEPRPRVDDIFGRQRRRRLLIPNIGFTSLQTMRQKFQIFHQQRVVQSLLKGPGREDEKKTTNCVDESRGRSGDDPFVAPAKHRHQLTVVDQGVAWENLEGVGEQVQRLGGQRRVELGLWTMREK